MPDRIRLAKVNAYGEDPVVVESPAPPYSGAGLLLRMRCAALNFADLLKARGEYQEREEPPFIPGLEGAGEVLETVPGSGFARGDRVAVRHPGTMVQVIEVPQGSCLKIPDRMSFEQAAGFQIAYGTSHLALTLRAVCGPERPLPFLARRAASG
ncbi:alcohol dehydrogenase catalytic domain-containing protein [Paracoccus methylarcula]|uniref:alcohol dehydrogenase catalytic domain-containing protein n=1 Tax=Paracoccus methylarcula TaxID=72022 RepID=UPI00344E741F